MADCGAGSGRTISGWTLREWTLQEQALQEQMLQQCLPQLADPPAVRMIVDELIDRVRPLTARSEIPVADIVDSVNADRR